MILQRLYELATRPNENLLADLAFEELPVPYVIILGQAGEYLGVQERRGTITIPARKKGAEPKTKPDKGRIIAVPRPHGSPANPGFARFFLDTLPRVLPFPVDEKDREKAARSRATFWAQMQKAADETQDPALRAVQRFGDAVLSDTGLAKRVLADLDQLKPTANDRCTFAWDPDQGKTILERPEVRDWYQRVFQAFTDQRQQTGPRGICQITGQFGPIPTSHSIKLGGVPGGLPTGVSVVSYDKQAFESYGLEGTANAGISYLGADGYLRALNALIQNKLAGNPRTSLRVGDVLFLFWTREPADTRFMMVLDQPDPAEIERLFESARSGKKDSSSANSNQFYLLGLSGNSARAIIRDYLETPLPRVRDNLATWFRDLTIADATKDGAGKPSCRFPLAFLAVATALDFDSIAPGTQTALLHAALAGGPIPESVLACCLRRLRAEGGAGFRPNRMALIKLVLKRREVPVTETLSSQETDPAYLYGRLLAVFEQIQYAALGEVNANVVDKFYGTFSAAPSLVFSRLFANAQNHLRKLRGEKPGAYVALDRLLSEVSALLPASHPRGQLSLKDQGLFALGYYHQKARRFEEIAERKAQAAAKAQ
jgi:CRISPR-associated protein Csd1